ncbi:MAG: D-alanyl-D-alanine carboxypeptidase/D-alanyl-D-alanine-endopeptidase [bacterium]
MKSRKKYIYFILFILVGVLTYSPLSNNETVNNQSAPKHNKIIDKLKTEIENILASAGLKNTKYGLAIYSIDEKEYYYKKNIDDLLTPASNTKLFTTFAALYTLGDEHIINTSVYTDAKKIEPVLKGNLYIYGRGDALLKVTDLEVLAHKLQSLGIKKIEGNIYADDSYFDSVTNRKEYSNDADMVEPLPPITALTLERNTATVIATATASGVSVTVIPRSESFVIENNATLASLNNGSGIKESNGQFIIDGLADSKLITNYQLLITNYQKKDNAEMLNVGDAPPAPKRRKKGTMRITTAKMNGCRQKFIVNGKLRVGQTYAYMYFIDCPAMAVAGAFKNAMNNFGIEVTGNIYIKHIRDLKTKPMFVAEFGRPIMEIVETCNKESENFLAENLFKIVGAYAGSYDKTSDKSRAVKRLIYDSLGIDFKKCQINDGSGLSRRNLVTTRALIATLIKSQYLPFAENFYNSLAIAGIDGTLYKRMVGTPAENNVCAKTGTLRNVSSLAGYVNTVDGELLAFAMIFNGPYVYNYKATENKIAILLAGFGNEE